MKDILLLVVKDVYIYSSLQKAYEQLKDILEEKGFDIPEKPNSDIIPSYPYDEEVSHSLCDYNHFIPLQEGVKFD